MKQIDSYILEKLKIDSNTEVGEGKNYVHPGDKDAEQVCKDFKTDTTMFCKYENGRNNVGKVKLMLGDGHFYIKPTTAKNISEKLPTGANISHSILQELVKVGLGDSYIIDGKESRIDTSSRINNLKRTYHYFYLGHLGMIFKDKKEANSELRKAREEYRIYGQYRCKVMTIEEASKMESSIYGDSINDIYFI